MKAALFTVCLAMLFTVATANAAQAPASLPHIAIQTSEGRIVVKLNPVAAPLTVNHTLSLVDEQFFINVVDNRQLDPAKAAGNGRWGYAVFGTVVEGMAVADRIAAVPTGRKDELSDVPETPVVIESIRRFVPE